MRSQRWLYVAHRRRVEAAINYTRHLDSQNVGFVINPRDRHLLRHQPRLRLGVREVMSPLELIMGSIVAAGLTAYLVYAMLRPEKF